MNTVYAILVFIHIFSAILGLGPGFTLIPIVKTAKTLDELRHAFYIKNRLHIFIMVGGTLLLLSGLSMGAIHPYLFHMGWYLTSLVLFLIALAMGPIVLSPVTKPLKARLAEYKGTDIPEEIKPSLKMMYRYEGILNLIFIAIIVLMITKPF
ncbi:MAG: DUF2269 family protein [Tuberibacillus sp.]